MLPAGAAKDVFLLTYDRMRRYEGAWHTEKKLLFPSYVFLESENETFLAERMRICSGDMFPAEQTDHNDRLIRVGRQAEDFLRFLYRNAHHLEMSKGIIQNGIPKITAGPLKGMEEQICRIDRHKRLAKLTMPADLKERNMSYITAGLEIAEKSM